VPGAAVTAGAAELLATNVAVSDAAVRTSNVVDRLPLNGSDTDAFNVGWVVRTTGGYQEICVTK
jgi:hypothetical protein